MNSLVSYKWLSQYVDLKGIAPDEFARKMSLCGPAVEKIVPRDELLENVVVGKILEVNPHPNADKLRICMVDAGEEEARSERRDSRLERREASLTQIVCGGSNLEVGQFVALAKIGARVKWHGEGEPVTLEAAKLRGVESFGMICGANEIGLGEAFPHEEKEILDLGKELGSTAVLKPGTPIGHLFGLTDDVVMDIEVTGNRVDAMGMIGMAREASAILDRKMLWKDSNKIPRPTTHDPRPIFVKIHDKKLCRRYMGVRVTGLKNGQSPWWMKNALISAGLNPISLLVDITNYILLEYAQPMHVFDVARLRMSGKTPELHARSAKAGETMVALDGKSYDLDEKTLVIADAEGPVAIAGIMGGEHSGSYEDTTDVIFECAAFDPVSIRRTSRRLNLYSDSQLRFEKGLSAEGVPFAMARAIELACDLGGGTVVAIEDVYPTKAEPLSFSVSTKDVEDRMGVKVSAATQKKTLQKLGFKVTTSGKMIKAVVPWWRDCDIEDGVDLIEEIARIYGYSNIPAVLPIGELPSRSADMEVVWEDRVKEVAKGAGMTECYSYSFVSRALFEKSLHDADHAYKLLNPLSEEFAIMRTTIAPSLLQVVADNQEREKNQSLFEVANAYLLTDDGKGLPDESLELACVYFGEGDLFKKAKGFVEHLFSEIGVLGVTWKRVTEQGFWHPGRTIQVFKDDVLLATIGEVAPNVLGNFKIDGRVAMVHAYLENIFQFAGHRSGYSAPSIFPESRRDLAIVVDGRVEYGDVEKTIRATDSLITSVEWFDTYQGKGLPEGKKSLAMHIVFASTDRTLTSEEVDELMKKVSMGLEASFKAEIR